MVNKRSSSSSIVVAVGLVLACCAVALAQDALFPPPVPSDFELLELDSASEYDFLKSPHQTQTLNLFHGDHGHSYGTFVYSNRVVVGGVPGRNFETATYPIVVAHNKAAEQAIVYHGTTFHNFQPGNQSAVSVLAGSSWLNYRTSKDFPTIDSWSEMWLNGTWGVGVDETIDGYKSVCYEGFTFDHHLAKCKGLVKVRACFISKGAFKGKPIYISFSQLLAGSHQDFVWIFTQWNDDVPNPALFILPPIYNGKTIPELAPWASFGGATGACAGEV